MRSIVIASVLVVLVGAATASAQVVYVSAYPVVTLKPVAVAASPASCSPYAQTVSWTYQRPVNVAPQPASACYRAYVPAYPTYTVARPVITYRPVVPVVPMPRAYVIGRGIVGQPTVYVPGQPIRNALRWVSP